MIIVDAGSCHMGNKDYALELIEQAKKNGADAIKFQLFKDIPPNIPLDYDWIPDLKIFADKIGIELFVSVWDMEGIEILQACKIKSIKFAFSDFRRKKELIDYVLEKPILLENPNVRQIKKTDKYQFEKIFISGDIFTNFPVDTKIIKLFCIPEYPVNYLINFSQELFKRFDGFSDHTMGINQTKKAISCGAKYIEKHFTIEKPDIDCPDYRFAIKPKELKELTEWNKNQKS